MNYYIDTSCLLRRLLNDGPLLPTWGDWENAYVSVLGRIEVHRTLYRTRIENRLTDETYEVAVGRFADIAATLKWVPMSDAIIAAAAGPFPTVVKALDAIHLASAIAVRDAIWPDLVFATHDRQLAAAAALVGFDVAGV